jgi:glycosyltransferase involved in cell wall biosynthesis
MATRFAVVVTCYNYIDYVVEAVESALAQDEPAAQVIIVDDGSTDGSTQLLVDRYGNDPRVTLLSGPNGGQLAAFQRGLAAASADVVCFLDADDRWRPDYLRQLREVFDARRDIDFVFSDVQLFGAEQRRIGWSTRAEDLGFTAVSTYLKPHWYGAPTSALALRTAMARRCLALPGELLATWRICADNCLVYGASLLGARKYFLPTGAVGYRVHGNNGWYGRRTHEAIYLNKLHSRGLIEHYARTAGLSPLCVDLVRREFLTKPKPARREVFRYAGIALYGDHPWWTRYWRALRILLRLPKTA